MLALVDGDIIVYRIGFTTEDVEEKGIVHYRIDELIDKIILNTHADEFSIFLSDSLENNFRYEINPQYKANRKDAPKPKWYNYIKEYLITRYGATIALGHEADDELGINQDKGDPGGWELPTTVICSIDKDLLQISGRHYNFVTDRIQEVSLHDGLAHFYWQLVLGDRVDNIGGFDGIMRSSEPKFLQCIKSYLQACRTEQEMFWLVHYLYGEVNEERLLMNGRCLKIKQERNEPLWSFPVTLPTRTEESQSESTPKTT